MRLPIEAARGRGNGARVLVLVRPEAMSLEPATNGGGLSGEVVSHTFLGFVTRVRIEAPGGELSADVSSSAAAGIPVGRRVSARFPTESARVLDLGDEQAPPAPDPDDH